MRNFSLILADFYLLRLFKKLLTNSIKDTHSHFVRAKPKVKSTFNKILISYNCILNPQIKGFRREVYQKVICSPPVIRGL